MKDLIKKLLTELTLEEKAALCSGVSSWETTPIERLGIPSAFVADGPHGVRREVTRATFGNIFMSSLPATCFPPAVTLASSWNTNLVRKVGEAIAEECLEQKVDVVLGPGINIKRNPMCGRNFEYMSEDPYLSGKLGAAYIKGVQSKDVGTSLKHFAVNSQEYRRLVASSELDERTLREIYLSGFEIAVKEGKPYTVMCSYNPINGIYASDNKKLLNGILRQEWGFDGIVVSDWGAVNDRVRGILAGLNLEMPTSNGIRDKEIVKAVNDGNLTVEILDKIVAEILEFVFKCVKNREKHPDFKANYEGHHQLARIAAAEGTVLLKNNGILPLKGDESLAIVGQMAKKLRSQGSGSSKLNPKNEVSFTAYLDSIKKQYEYSDGYSINNDKVDNGKILKAVNKALGKDVAIAYIGLVPSYESESFDRNHINLPPAHNALIEELCKHHKNVIVVFAGGSPVTMPWFDKVAAVVNVYLGGEAGGEATYDILYGNVNPSGKLAETFPLNAESVMSTHYFGKDTAEYRESIFVGYRYFDTAKKPVLFPFGYGLSYTTFEYSNLALSSDTIKDGEELIVTFDIQNTGKLAGAEVAQVYVRDTESTHFVAEKELKGFDKVYLEPGEKKTVTITLDKRSFAFYNTDISDWCVEKGDFDILVGKSSKDIVLSERVFYDAPETHITDLHIVSPVYYNLEKAAEIPSRHFENLLGRPITEHIKGKKGTYDFNTVVGELDGSIFCRIFRFAFKKGSLKMLPKNSDKVARKMTQKGAMDMPVRNFYAMSAGAVPYEACVGLLMAFNGKTIKGIIKLIKSFIRKPVMKSDIYK